MNSTSKVIGLFYKNERFGLLRTCLISRFRPAVLCAPKKPRTTSSDTLFQHPAFVRGKAYLLLHRGKEAAAEFQKLLDHRGVVINSPLGALARLGVAEAYLAQDDTARARAAFKDFLTLWRDADPDIPILQQAKAEYAKIQ